MTKLFTFYINLQVCFHRLHEDASVYATNYVFGTVYLLHAYQVVSPITFVALRFIVNKLNGTAKR